MQKLIAESTAQYPVGTGPGSKVFKIKQGKYAGRIVVLFQSDENSIRLCWSDYPYRAWSDPQTMVNSADDLPFEAALLSDNAIVLAYTASSGGSLITSRLIFVEGSWVPQTPVIVHDQDDNYYPGMVVEPEGKLWAAWCRDTGTDCYLNAKSSNDGGATWSNIIDLTGPVDSAVPKLICDERYIYTFYVLDANRLAYRRKGFHDSGFESENEVVNVSGISGNFDLALSENGRLGLVYDAGELRFREFDGENWSAALTVDSGGGDFPQIQYARNIPYIIYVSSQGGSQSSILYSYRVDNSFASPVSLEQGERIFDRVVLFETVSGAYEDLTSEAADANAGDVFHSGSSALLSRAGDSLYLGMNDKFNFVRFNLSTAGSGGTEAWSYFNGTEWCGFTPHGGTWNFTGSDKALLFWEDSGSIPSDWQKRAIQESELYWIRIAVTAPFGTVPTGTQLSAIPNNSAIMLLE